MNRADAYTLLCESVTDLSLRRHCLSVEAAMRAYARKLGQDEETWGVVGLLHDFDYERWPNPPDHPLKGSEILREKGIRRVITAILSHADYLADRFAAHAMRRGSTRARSPASSPRRAPAPRGRRPDGRA